MEAFVEFMGEVPRYAVNLVRLVSAPRRFGLDHASYTQAELVRAWAYLGISIFVTIVIRAPIRPGLNGADALAGYAVWAAVVVLVMSVVLRLSWRLVGAQVGYLRFLILDCYYFGTFMVVGHTILLLADYALRLERYTAANAIAAAGVVLLALWCLQGWQAFASAAGLRWARSLAAFLIVLVLSTPTLGALLVLRCELTGAEVPGSIIPWLLKEVHWPTQCAPPRSKTPEKLLLRLQ